MTQEDLEQSRLRLDQERVDIERMRYELDRERLTHEKRAVQRNLGAILGAVVTLVGITVSGAQVWVAQISKDKEIQITKLKNEQDSRRLEDQHEKDWNL